MKTNYNSEEIESILSDLIKIIELNYEGKNPFKELEAGLRIVKNRNYNYYSSILTNFRQLAYILYDDGITDTAIFTKMAELRKLINHSSNE